MAIRQSLMTSLTSAKSRRRRELRALRRQKSRRDNRGLNLEQLEDRRLLAGLQLAGISTNENILLSEGDVLNTAPHELKIRFSEQASLNPATLAGGIEVIRSGGDGIFGAASVTTDMNTLGAVLVKFTAAQPGEAGEGIVLEFSKSDRGVPGNVGVSVEDDIIRIDINSNVLANNSAADVVNAVNAHPEANRLVVASIAQGNSFANVSTPAINYTPLTLSGANQARAISSFGQGTALQVEFVAVAPGVAGNGQTIRFSNRDFGGPGGPNVSVVDGRVDVELNIHAASPTTAQSLVSAINSDPDASQLVSVRIVAGRGSTAIGNGIAFPDLVLQGSSDIVLTPGYVGIGETDNIAVFRFSETLPDDVYQINLLGRAGFGRNPIADEDGNIFLDGMANHGQSFELDLGARVLSVVPQPLRRSPGGQLVHARNEIEVYFNDDDLSRASAENVNFYQLILTETTARTTDDSIFRPVAVSYDPHADRAVLTFADDLAVLAGGAATFRLRIGTAEALPLAPVVVAPADAGSSFATALDLSGTFDTGSVLHVSGRGVDFLDQQTFTIFNAQGTGQTFEFEETTDPNNQGVTSGNEPVLFDAGLSNTVMVQRIASAIDNANFGVTSTVIGNTIFLTGESLVTLDPAVTGMARANQGAVISGEITNDGQPFLLDLPGSSDQPGHRDIPVQDHLDAARDTLVGVTEISYNFQEEYGFDPQGNVLRNAISNAQIERAREIFEIYGEYLGIDFVETSFRGLTIAVGDIRAVDPTAPAGTNGRDGLSAGGPTIGIAVLSASQFDDQNDEFGGAFFQTAMREIGSLLGFGPTTELPPYTVMGGDTGQSSGLPPEPVFPGDAEIIHGQHLHRPEVKDIDLYEFEITAHGRLTAEAISERLPVPSHLDTVLNLYRQLPTGQRELVARNDDYFASDSYLSLDLSPGTYFIGVSASGNNDYNPAIEDSGFGGTSEGNYELRLDFRGEIRNAITDVDNLNNAAAGAVSAVTPLDGDADGDPGGVFNFWFQTQTAENTFIVDKAAGSSAPSGTLQQPFTNIQHALAAAQPGDIVRIVGNGGADGDITTTDDNLAYEIGFSDLGGQVLADGASLEVPQQVTVMIDSGAIIKSRRGYIAVGSTTTAIDRSAGALQILGTPRVINSQGDVVTDPQGRPLSGDVILTSLHEEIGIGTNPDNSPPAPVAGDWGGVLFRADLDSADENRFNYEDEGIFLNHVSNASIRFGGGNVVIDGDPTLVDPIHVANSRPTIAYNTISQSAHAAISANPDSFLETSFLENVYQFSGLFTPDYARRGPDIDGNTIVDNTINGIFVRIDTLAGNQPERLNVPGRFDDSDIVHVLQENLVINGQPGGLLRDTFAPPSQLITPQSGPVGGTLQPGTYSYRMTFVDATGAETPASDPTDAITIAGNPDAANQANIGQVILRNLPTTLNFTGFVARRIYRSTPAGTGPYTLVSEINATSTSFIDNGTTSGGQLDEAPERLRARPEGRLRVDPGTIIKVENALIELKMGADFIAEGADGRPIVFTSLGDIRYGAGGDFDTNNQNAGANAAQGDWGGIFSGYLSSLNLDHTIVAYAGGEARLEGGFRTFNPIEIHRSDARIANSILEFNASGFNPVDGNPASLETRFGRGFNRPGTIFVRGAQPTIVNNILRDNPDGPAISVDVNSLNHKLVSDPGRATGPVDLYDGEFGNQGALVSGNRLDNNGTNGMFVRGGILTTEGVWDDTSIVHTVTDTIAIPDFHTYGGLRLESTTTESLVVKLEGPDAGFTAYGNPLDITDRIGGALHIVGQPGSPVVLTSIEDDSVGAGLEPDGAPQTDTNNNAVEDDDGTALLPTGPEVDNGLLIDNDVPVNIPGFFQALPEPGGSIGFGGFGSTSGVTFDGTSGLNINRDVIFEFLNYIDPEGDGSGVELLATNITQNPTLVSDDVVVSTGNFQGQNGQIDWVVTTSFQDGVPTLFNTVTFTSDNPLGNLQFVNYLDEDVSTISDLLYLVGTPGAADFRAFTIGDFERVGFSQGGIYEPGPGLVNATYTGFAADVYSDLRNDITNTAVPFTIAGTIDTTALPPLNDPELGLVYGPRDVTTAFAWNVDPNATSATITSFLELVPRNPALQQGAAGDWRSVRLEPFSHDRNVDIYTELEPFDFDTPGTNTDPAQSEFVGRLAEHLHGGDEELRLGVEIHGAISSPGDVDTYTFKAHGGTEVWLDIDDTSHSLDTILELVDADGVVLARSDNSVVENADPSLLFRNPAIPENHINPLQKSDFNNEDNYTINPYDAGMRIVLPGDADAENSYFVRVRSASPQLNNLRGGTSAGAYQLQVRLREQDEVPGSVVRYADIRFATNGIEILGQPIHSPLVGETGDIDNVGAGVNNNTVFAGGIAGQNVGNVFETDRGALSIAGTLHNFGGAIEVDAYTFEVDYELTETNNSLVPLTLDIDYADGLERPDTFLSVYDAAGNLRFVGNDSNITEDLPAPLHQNDFDDFTRGSVNTNDAFIGPVTVVEGIYSAAVTAVTSVPAELGQFFLADPLDPLFRLEPIESVDKIAAERLDGGPEGGNVQVPVLFDNNSIVPWTLADVTLYVSQSSEGGQAKTSLSAVNPATGVVNNRVGSFTFDAGDIALRPNGELRAFSQDFSINVIDETAGEYLLIDPATGAAAVTGWTGIETYEENLPQNAGQARNSEDGIHFDAVAFGALADQFTERGFGVGRRVPFSFPPSVSQTENILYQFTPDTGEAFSNPAPDRPDPPLWTGAGTQIRERGLLDTTVDSNNSRDTRLVAEEATTINNDGSVTWNLVDGDIFTVDDGNQPVTFEFVSGPEFRMTLDPTNGAFIRDGDTFFLDGDPFEFDTGEVLVVDALSGSELTDGHRFSLADNQQPSEIRTFEFDDGTGIPVANGVTPVPFNIGMNRGAIVQAIVDAINSQTAFDGFGNPIFATSAIAMPTTNPLYSNRISLIDSSSATENATGIRIEGNTGRNTNRPIPNAPGTPLIKIEEIFVNSELATSINLAFNGDPGPPASPGIAGITAGAKGDRVNFVGVQTGSFTELESRGAGVDQRHDGQPNRPFAVSVTFLASDSREDVTRNIVAAINSRPPYDAVSASNDRVVQLTNAIFDRANTTLQVVGGGPGGLVTGLAIQNNQLWAVSDAGGLYRVVNPLSAGGAQLSYIDDAVDLVGIEFAGLTTPPRNVDGTAYRDDLLFGVDTGGRIYAFDLSGQLQPIFADGASSVQIVDNNGTPLSSNGQGDVTGFAFSNLDYNLWHVTDSRRGDAGHVGGNSLYFGFESLAANNVPADEPIFDPDKTYIDFSTQAQVSRPGTYDFPGGARGEIVSNEFDLSAYSAADSPTLYFNYFLETENAQATLAPDQFMRDAFRVFGSGTDGDWVLLATNNSAPTGELALGANELYDNGDGNSLSSWRQARIDLSNFAGQSGVQLRFEFSSDGGFDVGNTRGQGDRLYAIDGVDLRDATVVTIDGVEFEVELGSTIVAPSGLAIRDGETITIHGETFEFEKQGGVRSGNIAIPIADNQSPAAVAASIAAALQNVNYARTANLLDETSGNEVISTAVSTGLTGGDDIFQATGVIGDNPNLINPALDVDMMRLTLNAGDYIEVTASAAIGSSLDPLVRIFDASGNEVAMNDDSFGSTAQVAIPAVSLPGTYYVAVSASPNDDYDPTVQGLGTVGFTIGEYDVEIKVNDFAGVVPRRNGSRVQLDGAFRISQSAGAAVVLDGQPGVTRGRVPLVAHADMTDDQVALEIQAVLAQQFAGGYAMAFPVHQEMVRVLNHDVQDRGPFGLEDGLSTDPYGAFRASANFSYNVTGGAFPGDLGAADNRHGGVHIDDIVIGLAERGETVVGSNVAAANRGQFIANALAPANPITLGEYQLELRAAGEFAVSDPLDPTVLVVVNSLDSNDRLSQEHALVAPAASDIIDGQIFTISDGVNSVIFEFEDATIGNGVQPGRQQILFDPAADDGQGGLTAEDAAAMARRIRDAINSRPVQAVLDVTAATADGEVSGTNSQNGIVNLFGSVVIGDPTIIAQIQVDATVEPNDSRANAIDTNLPTGRNARVTTSGEIGDNPVLAGLNAPLDVDLLQFDLEAGSEVVFRTRAAQLGSTLDTSLRLFDQSGNEIAANDDISPFNVDSELTFIAPASDTYYLGIASSGNDTYAIDAPASGTAGATTGTYELEVDVTSAGVGFMRFDGLGDENIVREQGQLIISSSQISVSLEYGIRADAAVRDANGAPHPGVARHLSQINSQRLVPGPVIKNNVLAFNNFGGIEFSGQTNQPGEPTAVVPFGRIVNNTIYGVGGRLDVALNQDVGVLVSDNASPTLMNNIFANLDTGISVDASSSSTVIGGSLFQGNVTDSNAGLGARPILLSDVDPLFLDASVGNFYLAPGSQAIDSSMESLEDRQALVSVRDPLGIPKSPIIAPETDALGQLRADDPDVEPGNGAGENVFIDRGAIDRSDFAGPTAILIEPRDNDSNGDDQNPQLTVVELTAQSVEVFVVQLVDGVEPVDPANGVGVDDASVTSDQVKVFRDEIRLEDGIDYRFRYDSLNNAIRLIPLAGLWETNHSYRIEIANSDQFLIVAPAGDEVLDGEAFTILDDDGTVGRFEFETGYVLTVPETYTLQVPKSGGGLGGVTDLETFTINGTTFEFDNNGSVAAGNTAIPFTPTDNAAAIAQAVVNALSGANIGLAPKRLPNGEVHVGAQASDVIDITNAPSLTSRGSVAGGLGDGDLIAIDDGRTDQVFEIDVLGNGTAANSVEVAVLQSDTFEDVADKVAASIGLNTLLSPTHLGGGVIQVGGTIRTVIDSAGSRMIQSGRPGVSPSFGILIPTVAGVPQNINDGDTFRVGDGIRLPVTFEFDTNGTAVNGNTAVTIPDTNATMDQIANAIVQAIASVGLGVNPVNVGDGRVELQNATTSHLFNPLTSSLTQLGLPGVAASIPIPYVPTDTFTPVDMAIVIDAAIESSDLNVTSDRIEDEITLQGAANVQGVVQSFVQGVRDLAGNLLKPNQSDDATEFTILLGSGFDYGDAPNSYSTLVADGGPSHVVLHGYSLGTQLDVDVDGQPNATATGDDQVGADDEDGVEFVTTIRGFDGTLTVTTTGVSAVQPGRLDAWIDFNQDGDFDVDEQIFSSEVLVNGQNNLTYAIPRGAAVGQTFARFRLSSTGGLSPTGQAIDGEVEDHLVTIESSPWQNGVLPADVTGDGRLQPIDILSVVAFLSRYGAQDLPVPPPFVSMGGDQVHATNRMIDVDGNGRVQVLDAALVVSAIFSQNSGNSEPGQGEPSDNLSSISSLGLPPIDVMSGGPSTQRNGDSSSTVYEVEFSVGEEDLSGRSTESLDSTELVFDGGDDWVDDLAQDQQTLSVGDAFDEVFQNWE